MAREARDQALERASADQVITSAHGAVALHRVLHADCVTVFMLEF